MNIVGRLLAASLIAALPAVAHAAPAGVAEGVKVSAAARLVNDVRPLKVGADIFLGDLIETGPSGQVQIRFSDDTELVLGPSSLLRIEDYLIRNDGSAGKLAVDMLSGAFRFVSGDSAKNRYDISTPTGTIGVRGTSFDVEVDEAGETQIMLYEGQVRFCTNAGECKVLANQCDIGLIGASMTEILGNAISFDSEARKGLQKLFPYAHNQSSLLADFRVDSSRRCVTFVPPRPPSSKPSTPKVEEEPTCDYYSTHQTQYPCSD
jgi:hypothetical protein